LRLCNFGVRVGEDDVQCEEVWKTTRRCTKLEAL